KLLHRELGEPTLQKQRDVLKDLDDLLKKAEQPPSSKNNEQDCDNDNCPNPAASGGEKDNDKRQAKNSSRRQSRSRREQMSRRSGSRGSQAKSGSQPRPSGAMGKGQPGTPKPDQPGAGMNPGAGGTSPEDRRNRNADLNKNDVWG